MLLALRACCNIFKTKQLLQSVAAHVPAIIDRAASHSAAPNKNIRAAVTAFVHNVAVAVNKVT